MLSARIFYYGIPLWPGFALSVPAKRGELCGWGFFLPDHMGGRF